MSKSLCKIVFAVVSDGFLTIQTYCSKNSTVAYVTPEALPVYSIPTLKKAMLSLLNLKFIQQFIFFYIFLCLT